MRRAAEQLVRRQVSRTASSPAPVRGWNARDSIASMKPEDAVVLKNFFSTASDVALRLGSADHVTDIGGGVDEVETLAVYSPITGLDELWAFTDQGNLYNVTSADDDPTAELSGLSNGRWQHTPFSNTAGNFLLCVNGEDDMRVYDGSDWSTINSGSSPSITNVATSDLVHVHVHKGRVWYVQDASMSVWYTAVGAFAGALTEFDLSSIFRRGGYVVAMGSWTIDGGAGVDDLAVFVTSHGEVAIYQGTDPASASTWALVGIFHLGAPIGRRCFEQFAGDLLIITVDGVVPASRALSSARSSQAIALTDRIQTAVADASALYRESFGWQMMLFSAGSMLLLNVPVGAGQQEQYVQNTITGAWCRFTGWPAHCFAVLNDELYFGGSAIVRKAWTGASDAGADIEGEIVTAFQYFGRRTGLKQFKMIRPLIAWDSNPAQFLIGVDVDFDTRAPEGSLSLPVTEAGEWDDGEWDVAIWGGEPTLKRVWYTSHGLGFAAAVHLQITSSAARVRVSAFDWVLEEGGVL